MRFFSLMTQVYMKSFCIFFLLFNIELIENCDV